MSCPSTSYHQLPTPLGDACYLVNSEGQLVAFGWVEKHTRMKKLLHRVQEQGGALKITTDKTSIAERLRRYFAGELTALKGIETATQGTAFQTSVWAALRAIPLGETRSYGQLAREIQNPAAVRAVGLANGANPVSVVVPCHRVIGADGSLTGFGAGVERKRWLLEHEGVALRAEQVELPGTA